MGEASACRNASWHNIARCCSRPRKGSLPPRMLAEWILRDQLPVRLQVQLHKLLWGNEAGH